MSRIEQPVNQVRLTNVAVVRYKRKGKRFEIACYKNKVVNWRNKVETDIDEVLQIASVFTNVSKGVLAKNTDLLKAFETTDQEQVCRIILDKGELQVSDKERQVASESLYRDIVTIITDKCVNPESNRPYPFSVIERVMKEMHYAPVPNRSAKQQALEAIKQLKDHIPIERAKMKILVSIPAKDGKKVKGAIEKETCELVSQDWGAQTAKLMYLIDPGLYRSIHGIIQSETKGSGTLDVVELNCQQEGEHCIDAELKQKSTLQSSTTEEETKTSMLLPPAPPASTGLSCSTCGGDFGLDKQAHRLHYRSDWHRYNLKLKARKQPLVDEEMFDRIDQEDLQSFFEKL